MTRSPSRQVGGCSRLLELEIELELEDRQRIDLRGGAHRPADRVRSTHDANRRLGRAKGGEPTCADITTT